MIVYEASNKNLIYDQLIKLGNEEEAKDILRSQIVFLESILDFYIHEMTKYSYYKMFTNTWKKTSQYRNFKVKMETVEKGLNAADTQWFFEYVTDAFSRSVFLSNKSISNQLDAIGIPYQDVMHKVFSQSTVKESCTKGKEFIDHVFIRRNIIVHQNDRSHDSAIQNDITKSYVEETIETMKKIIYEIWAIANAK